MKKDNCSTGTDYDAVMDAYKEAKDYVYTLIQAEYYIDLYLIDCIRGAISSYKCRQKCKEIASRLPELSENFAEYYRGRLKRWKGAFTR